MQLYNFLVSEVTQLYTMEPLLTDTPELQIPAICDWICEKE